MRKLALLTSLALAGGTLTAAAEPQWRDRDSRGRDGYGYRDQDRKRMVRLAPVTSANSDRQFINLLGNHPRVRSIEIRAVRGTPVITQVAIQYVGQEHVTQVVKLSSRLSRGMGEKIWLNQRRPIQRIVVYTEPGYGGAYVINGN